ncbi:MAG: hypothetical protein OXJ90_12150 [Spirochaetaceae bacterium]|nr:hypothetical protein [Spirochaetaceae bacterium]
MAAALMVLVAMATYADRTPLTKPTGEAVTLGGVLSELMEASFACEPLEVDSWSGWRCSMETVTISIEGGAAGVWTLGLQSPDLSEAGADRVDEAIAMLYGSVLVFGQVSNDQDAPIDIAVGARAAEGGFYVLPLGGGVFAARQDREHDILTVIFRESDIIADPAATAMTLIDAGVWARTEGS